MLFRSVLRRLLPVLCMSALGTVPEDIDLTFPPLWTPTAREVAEIAKDKAETVIAVFQAGLVQADTAARELKKLSGETGLFDSITGREIAALRGKSYQDVTALRDPLAGLGFGLETEDALTLDYKGQPRDKHGRFTYGKLSGGSTSGGKRGKMSPVRMGKREAARVSSGILTDHPKLKAGEVSSYLHGKYFYRFVVKGPGDYRFTERTPIIGNEAHISQILKGKR